MDGMGYIFVYKHKTVSHLKQRGIEHTGGATEDGKNPFRCSVCVLDVSGSDKRW